MTVRARTLVCVRSFSYSDPMMGRQTCTEDQTYVDSTTWVARCYPEFFGPSDRDLGVTRDRPIHSMRLR